MKKYTRLWWALTFVIAGSLAVLGYYGWEIYQKMPPVPARVVSTDGTTLFTKEQIQNGQNVWQSIGGQEVCAVSRIGAGGSPVR